MDRLNLLNNCFIFFEQNKGGYHWISSCFCNPWFNVLLNIKDHQTPDSIPETLEAIEKDDFIHGWLMFDPQHGFLGKEKMDSTMIQYCDSYVWLLNMASTYMACAAEKTLNDLDFHMHYHLQKERVNNWKHQFGKENEPWHTTINADTTENDKLPEWFVWVAKWFLSGLNGPFGTVDKIPNLISSNFIRTKKKRKKSKVTFQHIGDNLLPNMDCTFFQQMDGHNCRVHCVLFMVDLVLSQVDQTWHLKEEQKGYLPYQIVLGSSLVDKKLLKKGELQSHLNCLYIQF